jgi:hypothetical protein
MNVNTVAWFIKFASQTAILFGLVWIMIKLQHLDQHDGFHILKVLGVVVFTGGLNMIPYIGHYLAVSALLVGIKKVTGSPYADVLFTVGLSYALMFAINIFIIMSLMGDLRPSTGDAGRLERVAYMPEEQTVDSKPETIAATNPPVPPAASHPASQVSAKPMPANPGQWIIKGLSRNGARSVVTIDTGVKAYTLFLGDTVKMQAAGGTNEVRFDKLDADWVSLNVDGKPVKLSAH